jgi:hypothetical protein
LDENQILYAASLVFGLITSAYHLSQVYALTYDTTFMDELRRLCPNRHPVLKSTISEEMAVKQAMARKLSYMIAHALEINKTKDLDSLLDKHYGQALKHYETAGKKTQSAGGFLWCWRQLLGKDQLLSRNGIWIPARMISANLTQYVVAIYLLIGGLFLTARVSEDYSVEWAKEYVYQQVIRVFRSDRVAQAVDSGMTNATHQMASFLSLLNDNGAIVCGDGTDSAEDLLSKYCPGTGNLTECNFPADVNVLCPLADSELLNASSQLAMLEASGFDGEALRQALFEVAEQSVESSVDSLFPS